jgi:hypothetical protein
MRRVANVASIEDRRGAYRFGWITPEGKRPLGRPRRRWEDNINMDLQQQVGRFRTRTGGGLL